MDEEASLVWGELSTRMQRSGKSLPVVDGCITALAVTRGALLATRNGNDFAETGVSLVNPREFA